MQRENKYTAIVLKKQAFNEADEIITFFTKESGKLRGLAKSIKLSKSKLQGRLQMLFLVNITLAGGNLPKIISAEIVEVFENLRANLSGSKMAFYASELILKLTADEEKNESLFLSLKTFLEGLSSPLNLDVDVLLAEFKINAMEAAGFSIKYAGSQLQALFLEFEKNKTQSAVTDLNRELSDFIEYQLERKLKSEKYLE